jgi:hypothetical protein
LAQRKQHGGWPFLQIANSVPMRAGASSRIPCATSSFLSIT